MKFEIGKEYRTRDGMKVTVVDINNNELYPIHGKYSVEECDVQYSNWTSAGRFFADPLSTDTEVDIISEWREPIKVEGWVNVYMDIPDYTWIYTSRAYADQSQGRNRIACIYVTGEEEL